MNLSYSHTTSTIENIGFYSSNSAHPYGMLLPGKRLLAGMADDGTSSHYTDAHGTEASAEYRYGFQGQEQDDEVKGKGNSVNYKYRMHDPRIGRFFAVDPLAPKYPELTPYQFSSNSPVYMVEVEGLEGTVSFAVAPAESDSREGGGAPFLRTMMDAPPAGNPIMTDKTGVVLPGNSSGLTHYFEDGSSVTGPYHHWALEQIAIDRGTYYYISLHPIEGTDPKAAIKYGYFYWGLNAHTHTHSDAIDQIFASSGGSSFYGRHNPAGELRPLAGELQSAIHYMSQGASAQASNLYTNADRAFFVSDEVEGSQVGFINWMLGSFINGDGPENYVFGGDSPFTDLVMDSRIVINAYHQYLANGRVDGAYYGNYGAEEQMRGMVGDGTVLTIENFIGSATVFFKKIDRWNVQVTVVNVTSLTSGDYGKHMPYHWGQPVVSNVRGTGVYSENPAPYSNISQTFTSIWVIPPY